VGELKERFPECTKTNSNKTIIFLVTAAITYVGKKPLEKISKRLFDKILTQRKFPLGSEVRASKVEMLSERVFKLFMMVFCILGLYSIMLKEDCDFLDKRVGGPQEKALYFVNYPCQKLPSYLDEYYLFRLAYHFIELLYTIGMHRNRPDFPEYVLHHLMTWSLIFFSYSLNYLPIGAAVMMLHDTTDLFVTIFKLTIDITPRYIYLVTYILMIVSWGYMRLWYFPIHVIVRAYEECFVEGQVCAEVNFSYTTMLLVFLCMLFFLHIFWYSLMISGISKLFFRKNDLKAPIMTSIVNRDNCEIKRD
jgi:ceramide synthetase